MHIMREKTKVVQPQIDKIREKIKEADSQEERNAANQLLMKNISNMVSIHLKILSVVSCHYTNPYPYGIIYEFKISK